MGAGVAAGAGADGVGFVHHQQRAVAADDLLRLVPETGFGQDHADVGHDRLGQHAGHIACRQRRVQGGEVVELHHDRVFGQVVHLPEQAVALHRLAVYQVDEHVFDGAVVTAVEDQDLPAAGGGADPAHDVAVGVGRAHGELPLRQAKALCQQLAHHGGVLGREHGGVAPCGLPDQGGRHRRRRVPEHGAGVAQTEVGQPVAVDVGDLGAFGLRDVQGKRRAPVTHPVQRHAEQQVLARLRRQSGRLRVGVGKTGAFALQEAQGAWPVQAGAGAGGDGCGCAHARLLTPATAGVRAPRS